MKTLISIVVAGVALWAAGCGNVSVQEDWDPDYDFSEVVSYAWLPLRATPNISDARLKRLVAAIDAEMAAKDLALTADDPTVLLELHVMSELRLDLNQYGATSNWDNQSTGSSDLDKGSVMINVIDGEERELVWRAVADGKVDPSASPEEQQKNYAKLAKKLLERFPPQSK
jgi:hypothetical protein